MDDMVADTRAPTYRVSGFLYLLSTSLSLPVSHLIDSPRIEIDWTIHPRMRSLLAVNTVVLPMET